MIEAGAKVEIENARGEALEDRVLALFQGLSQGQGDKLTELVDTASSEFIEDRTFCRPNVTESEIAGRFADPGMPEGSMDALAYTRRLLRDVVADSVHTSSPQMIGHMTSALPSYMQSLAKLIVAMNQNVVKTETAKSVTFLEREALAQLHKFLYRNSADFYEANVQNPRVMLGLFTSGGTLANTSALWVARNSRLGPTASFGGVQEEGLTRALRHYGFEDAVVVGSQLMHYSMDKASDLLGVGVRGLVKIPVDSNYQVDLLEMERYLIQAREDKTLVLAIVGICGATETGAIDPLQDMATLAAKYMIHFHVDAAWGGPCIFSRHHRSKARGIELADTITLDGHKQLWLPMGSGLVFLKDPRKCGAISKTANYIIREDSYDLGKFTIEGSRPAHALFLHANLQVLGCKGYEVLFDRTVRVARYMARCIMRSVNFELLVKPMTNILLYRWLPHSLRDKVWSNTLTDAENSKIDECNRQLQDLQKQKGTTFVSRTTVRCPKYDLKPIVALRVVIGNPLTCESDIDAVFADQDLLVMGRFFTEDFTMNPAAIVERDIGKESQYPETWSRGSPSAYSSAPYPEAPEFRSYWDTIWDRMGAKERFVFDDDINTFLDALTTPDCLIDREIPASQKQALQRIRSSEDVLGGHLERGLATELASGDAASGAA